MIRFTAALAVGRIMRYNEVRKRKEITAVEQEQILYNKILCCNGCSQTAYMPFCFPIHNQPVMIVSAIPSLQAMYKPLSSIRFFRNLCYALLGDVVLRDKTRAGYYLREFCDSNGCIYWTHYRKCYQPELNSFDELAERMLTAMPMTFGCT